MYIGNILIVGRNGMIMFLSAVINYWAFYLAKLLQRAHQNKYIYYAKQPIAF